MSGLTTHVLDAVRGGGAVGVGLTLRRQAGASSAFEDVARGSTDVNGRAVVLPQEEVVPGVYELVFATLDYHRRQGLQPFFDDVTIRFRIEQARGHYHVPIVLAPGAYSTYRGGVPPGHASALPPELAR